MKIVARTGTEAHYVLCSIAVALCFARGKLDPILLCALAAAICFARTVLRQSGNAASTVTLGSQELVASFTLRSSLHVPLSRIAAVDVHRRSWGGRLGKSSAMTFITIFREDEPAVIEIATESSEAEPFLDRLIASARLHGRRGVAPFVLPWSFYLRDLMPMVLPLAFVLLFPSVRFAAYLAGAIGYVVAAAFLWRRYAAMANRIRAHAVPDETDEWSLRLRASSR